MTQPRVAPPPLAASSSTLERARSGDKRAFERLYREHVGNVHGLCLRMWGGDVRRAEEATQRTFIKAWKGLGRFRGDAAFGTWLHRIAVRVVLDQDKASWFRRARDPIPLDQAASSPVPGQRLDLERAIATLPAKARRVLVLHDIEGWRHSDIAETLGVSVGTSKSQLSRARSLLRERLT